ncbi:hypothetical protein [uncultured Duncaniella sp.]|uniref:hypothetical protein n=1 Tax=uncultured Duncaniella sp. TaxID=2768039 RepID=UPI0026267E8C|nr:hypothetical protein [uncultured Duncaniella sp.]
MRKYILIPEYRPLYAMRRCFGPTHGPLERPTLTPIDVIGDLLKQTGSEQLSIYEVVKAANNKFSEPVQLTQTNYMKPYEEILENPSVPGQVLEEVKPPKPVHPTAVTPPAPPKKDSVPQVVPKKPNDFPTPEEPMPASAAVAENDAVLQGETVKVVLPDETPTHTTIEVNDTATVSGTAEAEAPAPEPEEEAIAAADGAEDAPVPEEEAAETSSSEDSGDTDKPELPKPLPGEAVLQSGPYAGLTKSQKNALKAAAKGMK